MSGNHFIAVEIDEAARERLATSAARLRDWQLNARWVHPLDYHITTCFLGRLEADEARVIPHAIDDIAAGFHPGPMRLPGLGAFGGRHVPRVIYAAVADPQEACAHLAHDLHAALDVPSTRPYLPHITLCRPQRGRPPAGRDWPDLLAAYGQALWGAVHGVAVVYCESADAGPDQPRHMVLERWSARQAPPRAGNAGA
ncbi:MAG: RNA 2',3'-cyclic phosphodiesterase [Planctomycetota bacterium]